jgi:hypothetical protein
MAGIKPAKQDAAWRFAQAALPTMTQMDKDGVGYVAGHRGEIFGERWLKPKHAFRNRDGIGPADRKLLHMFGPAVSAEPVYNSFGSLREQASAILLHSRMATCARGLANTHPFVQGNTALIHNGVISNAAALKNLTSTCDSECILNAYVDSDVSGDAKRIGEVAKALRGYYACGVITNASGRQVVDIFKDERASLHVAYVDALETYVFATTPEILRAASKKSKMRLSALRPVNAGYLIRLDAASGATISVTKFEYDHPYVAPATASNYGNYRAAEVAGYLTAETLASDDAPDSDDQDAQFQLEVARRVNAFKG